LENDLEKKKKTKKKAGSQKEKQTTEKGIGVTKSSDRFGQRVVTCEGGQREDP